MAPESDETRSPDADEHWQRVRDRLGRTLVCLDFDGTLAPIVDDPTQAYVHPDASEVLRDVASRVLAVAVVTGRPAQQVLELGHLDAVADSVGDRGRVEVRGQYGNEQWSSRGREVRSPEPPESLAVLRDRLPALLEEVGLSASYVEDKGLAIAVHTRRLPSPDDAARAAYDVLAPVVEELGLALEPGRRVVEVRAPGVDKGATVEQLAEELAASAIVFVGDDLGDLPAFEAVERLRRTGTAGLLVCSGSEEQVALVEHADVVVPGPDGVMALLRQLVAEEW